MRKLDLHPYALFQRGVLAIFLAIAAASWMLPASAQNAAAPPKFKRLEALTKAGRHVEALKLAEQMADDARRQFGSDGLEYGLFLGVVADVQRKLGRNAEALQNFRREVAILEKDRSIRPNIVGDRHVNIANILAEQRRYGEAERHLHRAIASMQKAYGPKNDAVANTMHTLATILRSDGRNTEAERWARRALAILWTGKGPLGGPAANVANTLAIILSDLERHAEAEPLARRAADTWRRELGADSGAYANALNTLVAILSARGRNAEAEPFARDVLRIWQKGAEGPESGAAGNAASMLTSILMDLGRPAEAEPFARLTVRAFDRAHGTNSGAYANALNTLVSILKARGRSAEAEPFAQEALRIWQRGAEGPESGAAGNAANTLASILMDLGRPAEAEPFARLTVRAWDRAHGVSSDAAANARNSLAITLERLGRHEDALVAAETARETWRRANGERDKSVARGSSNLAALYFNRGDFDKAIQLHEEAVSIWSEALGPDHRLSHSSLIGLTSANFAKSNWADSYAWGQRALKMGIEGIRRDRVPIGAGLAVDSAQTVANTGGQPHTVIRSAYQLVLKERSRTDELASATFEVAQWARSSTASAALAQMATRTSAGSAAIAAFVRERQDRVAEWQAKDKMLLTLQASRLPSDQGAVTSLRNETAAIEARVAAIDQILKEKFPKFAELSDLEAVKSIDLQKYLLDDEALILTLETQTSKYAQGETFIWLVTKTDLKWVRSNLGTEALREKVAALRCGLDEEEWVAQSTAQRCTRLLGMPDEQLEPSRPLPFHLGIAHELYRELFGDLQEMIKGKRRLLIVPSGPLTSLPFHVLVTKAPRDALPETFDGYRGADWLGRTHGLVVLPSVSSLGALRRNAAGVPSAPLAYFGIGNPILTGRDQSCRTSPRRNDPCPSFDGARQLTASAGTPGLATVQGGTGRRSGDITRIFSDGAGSEAVLAHVRNLCPLPDTDYEIRCVSERFKEDMRAVRLDSSATKTELKKLSEQGILERYRIVHFATHGLLAGDVETMTKRQGEPALVMTPPERPGDGSDNGLLTASDVAQLRLNADWVVLSACNTAAGDKFGAEALSGLARAFFYAQARALLVSHWPVYSDAAVQLTTRTFAELDRNPKAGRAEALQAAMIELMSHPSPVVNAHPAVWAPFVVVGEGAR